MNQDFGTLKTVTRFPYYLLIPQHITESILAKSLQEPGIPVHRPYKVVDMRKNAEDARSVDVAFENGKSIRTRYVVAADGATSAVSPLLISEGLFFYRFHRSALSAASPSWILALRILLSLRT